MKKFFVKILLALMIFVVPEFCLAEEIVIFHTNDFHARILKGDDEGKTIGLAEMSGAVNVYRKNILQLFGLTQETLNLKVWRKI